METKIIFILLIIVACKYTDEIESFVQAVQPKIIRYLNMLEASIASYSDTDKHEQSQPRKDSENQLVENSLIETDASTVTTVDDVEDEANYEEMIVDEMNLLRSNPRRYAKQFIEPMLKQFDGLVYVRSDGSRMRTEEGSSAVEECIQVLKSHGSVGTLTLSAGMSHGAQDHVNDQSQNGGIGHDGSDGSRPSDRINRYGRWGVTAGENIHYGKSTPREVVIALLVDDGVSNRGHRTNLLNDDYAVTGVAFGSHTTYKKMCVITYAGSYSEQ